MNATLRFCSTCGAELTGGAAFCGNCGAPVGGLDGPAPARGFGSAISTCLSKYATAKGRASRSEYWYFVLFTTLVTLVFDGLEAATQTHAFSAVGGLFGLAMLAPSVAVTTRRMHDVNRSGWFQLLVAAGAVLVAVGALLIGRSDVDGLASGAGGVVLVLAGLGLMIWQLVLLASRGTPGPNRFG